MEKAETLSFPTVMVWGSRTESSWWNISWRKRVEVVISTEFEVWNTIAHFSARLKYITNSCVFSTYRKTMSWRDELWFVGVLIVTKCDSLGPLVIFHTFAKCCVLRYYYYVGTGYGFFSSTASHDLRIFTMASIRSPDKEIVKIPR